MKCQVHSCIFLHLLLEAQLVKVWFLNDRLWPDRASLMVQRQTLDIPVWRRDATARQHHHEANHTEPHDWNANDYFEEKSATLTSHCDNSSIGDRENTAGTQALASPMCHIYCIMTTCLLLQSVCLHQSHHYH